MGKASREKRDRKVQAQIQTALGAMSAANSGQAWYESSSVRVPLSMAFAIILTVVSVMVKDLRFLLWCAFCLLIYPCWVLSKNVGVGKAIIRYGSFVILIGALATGTHQVHGFLKESPLAITPVRIPLAHSVYPGMEVHGQYDFVVYNRSDDPHYQIWIKLLLNSEVVSPEMLEIDFPTLEERERAGMRLNEMAAGTMCLRGKDNIRTSAFLCVIDALNPRETFKIKLTAIQPFKNTLGNNIGEITSTLLRSYDKPSMHYKVEKTKMTGTAAEHNYPETFYPTAMIHLCSEKRNDFESHMPVTCTKNSKLNARHTK